MSLLGGVYGRAAGLRRAWYARHADRTRRLERPVVSVGNLTVGGSGKTPVVAALARLLLAFGERPAILTRGYGSRRANDGVVVVSDGRAVLAPTRESGDEPQMLARALPGVPVLVSPDRYLAGRLAECRFGCTVHLLDDGFQHVQLARDVDLLVMSAADTTERLLPWGRLRESLEAASVADALLVSGGLDVAESIGERLGVTPTFRVAPRYESLRLLGGEAVAVERGPRVVAVAGIARPERFFAALRSRGANPDGDGQWEVAREITFRDHHWFSRRDLASIQRAAADAGADLVVTTEKDAMRLEDVGDASGGAPWAFLPYQVDVEPAQAFATWIDDRLRAARNDSPRSSARTGALSESAAGASVGLDGGEGAA